MSYQESFDSLCVLLEEYADASIETLAEQIFGYLGLTGEDLIEHLDPPPGLRRWLDTHGLSLVVTHQAPAPKVWAALEEDEVEAEVVPNVEEQRAEDEVAYHVGDYVEYVTAPMGPRSQMQMGAGRITEVGDSWVYVGQIYLDVNDGDTFRRVDPPRTA